MSKLSFICFLWLVGVSSVYAQKELIVESYPLPMSVARDAADDEAIVIVKSLLPLTFSSTVDKNVQAYQTIEDSGNKFMYIKFTTGERFAGRVLRIACAGYGSCSYPLDLQPRTMHGIYVFDPDDNPACYYQTRGDGNRAFRSGYYDDAKEKYMQALDCSDAPDDNDISSRIERADSCEMFKASAEKFYHGKDYFSAISFYEQVSQLNPDDAYCMQKREECSKNVANQPRTIRGKVANAKGEAIAGVNIIGMERDAKGKLKNNSRETLGVTASDGTFTVVARYRHSVLEFEKGSLISEEHYLTRKNITGETMNVIIN